MKRSVQNKGSVKDLDGGKNVGKSSKTQIYSDGVNISINQGQLRFKRKGFTWPR